MRYLVSGKSDANNEAGKLPSKESVEKVGEFSGGFFQAGKLLDGAGLLGSKRRTRLVFRNGQATVKRGPYSGEHELPHALLLIQVAALEDAISWAKRYGEILGDGEVEVGKVAEPWDIGMMPVPDNAPLQMMLIDKADKTTEAGARSAQKNATLSQLKTEMRDAGVLQRDYTLKPSSQAKRLIITKNRMKVLDGPFAESKELIGGFALLEMADVDEVIAFCQPYVEILGGDGNIDIREVDQND